MKTPSIPVSWSAALVVLFGLPAMAVNAPTDGAASPAGPATIVLHWTDASLNETGFEVERQNGASWDPVAALPADTTYYYDRGRSPSTAYAYRVRATDAGPPSPWLDLGSAETTLRMNLVFVLADDMGYKDIVALRNPAIDGPTIYETPNLDTLVEQGMTIRNAYCSGPRCVVARRSVLSGKYDWRPEAVPSSAWYLDHAGQPQGGGLYAGGTSVNPATAGQAIPDNVTYGEAVQAAGYRTCYIGKYHLGQGDDQPGRGPAEQGFTVSIAAGHAGAPPEAYFPREEPPGSGNYTYYLPDLADTANPNEYLTDRLTDEAIGFIGEAITNYSASPFFITLAHYAVHTPVEAKPADIDYFTQRKSDLAAELAGHPMASTPLLRDSSAAVRMIQDNRVYAAMMKSYDDSLGAIRAYLSATDDPRNPGRKLSETTVLVVSSDHGGKSTAGYGTGATPEKRLEYDASDPVNPVSGTNYYSSYPTANYPYRQGKTWVYEGGLKIPLIVYYPGLTQPGTSSAALVHGADFWATFADMTGAPQQPGESTDSISFMLPVVQPGATARKRSYHFFTNASTGTANPAMAAYREGDYKLLYFMVQRRVELYHLAADPYERNDLAASRPELAAEMLQRVYQQHQSTGATMPKPGSNSWISEQTVFVDNGLVPSLPAVPDANPSGLTLTELSPTAIELNWTVNAGNATHSVVYRRADPDGETNYREIAYLPASVTMYRDTGLVPGGNYRYRVESENFGGWAAGNTGNQILTLSTTNTPLAVQAVDDTVTTVPGEVRVFDPRLNDVGEGALTITAFTQPTDGAATFDGERIAFHTPEGFAGSGITMTYTLADAALQTDTGTVTFALPVQTSGSDLGTWAFDDPPGTALEDTTSSSGLAFGGTTVSVVTDGSKLVITRGVDSSNLFRDTGPMVGAPFTSGRISLRYHLASLDYTESAPPLNNVSCGFGFRDSSAGTNFGILRVREQNNKLRLEIRTTGNNLLHEFAALTLSNLTLTTTLDLDAGRFESSMSLDGGDTVTPLPNVNINPAASACDVLRFTAQNSTSVWFGADAVSIERLEVSREVNQASLYTAWATTHPWQGVLDQDPFDDADQDGRLNLFEFAFGLQPTVPETCSVIDVVVEGPDAVMQFTPVRDTSRIRYAAQRTDVLEDWTVLSDVVVSTPAGQAVDVPLPGATGAGYGRVTVRQL